MDKSIISTENVKAMAKAFGRVSDVIRKLLESINVSIMEFHKFLMAADPKYARKFRHLRKYTRMYERGKRKHG